MVPLQLYMVPFCYFYQQVFLINEFGLLLRSSVGSGSVAAVDKYRKLQWLFERS